MHMSDNLENSVGLLIAETDKVVARDLELTLQSHGYRITGVPASAEEARHMVERDRPDLVLLSIKFGGVGGDGIALANELRESHSVPVMFITGHTGEAVFEQARTARPLGYVRKPFSHAELIASLEAAVFRIKPDEDLNQRIPAIRSVAEPLEEGVIASGIDGRIVLMNQSAEVLTGWEEAEAAGLLYSEVIPTTYPAPRKNGAGSVPGGGSPCLFTDRSGKEHSVLAITTPVRDEQAELLGTITILKQRAPETPPENGESGEAKISENKRSEILKGLSQLSHSKTFRELTGSEAEEAKADEDGLDEETESGDPGAPPPHAPLLDQLGDPLLILNRDLEVVQANAEAIEVFSSESPLPGQSIWDLFSEEEKLRYENQFLNPLVDGRRHQFEFQDTERAVWFEVRAYRSHEGVIALFHDVTESRVTKAEEVRQQRLEGLGLLARGFAHDFNNHLTTVTGNIELAKDRETDPDLLEMLGEAEVATSKAADLVQQLMTFATGGRPVKEPVKIPEMLRQILSDHRRAYPSIRYQFQCTEPDLKANVDRAQIRRVVENMVNNAELAMPNGGILRVRCGKVEPAAAARYQRDIPEPAEDFLLVEVIDNGAGMDAKTLSKATEPYFSTRSEDNATGIGLTVCESIATAHDGFLQLKSAAGKGTQAIFCVPLGLDGARADWKAESRSAEEKSTSSAEESEEPGEEVALIPDETRILILEDDAPIRKLMSTTLRRAGFQVEGTADGKETAAVYKEAFQDDNPFDLVITDLTVEEGIGGLETMRLLREIDPDVVAIVSSGYSDAPAMSNWPAFGYKGVIPKPYSPDRLLEVVEQVATRHPRRAAREIATAV